MGLFSFVKDAGSAMFGKDDDDKGKDELAEVLERRQEKKLAEMVTEVGIPAENLKVDLHDGMVTVTGRTRTQEDREKIVLLLGNTQGVGRVDDQLEVTEAVAAATAPKSEDGDDGETTDGGAVFHTVASGDTLGAIAKKYYGNAGKYPVIFEANTPMLKDADHIYPGQVLRIPPQA